jgi:hypothetical protein
MGDSYYPAAYGGGQLDFSGITQAARGIAGGLTDMWDSQSVKRAWAESGGDYNEAIKRLVAAGDTEGAAAVAKIHDTIEGGQNRYGMQIYFDQNGNPYQPMSQGGMAPVTLPDGTRIKEPVTYQQTPQGVYQTPKNAVIGGGGSLAPLRPGEMPVYGSQEEADMGNPVGDGSQPPMIRKDYVTPEAQKEIGDSQGKAMQALPASKAMTNRVIGAITKLESNPKLKDAIGPLQSRLPTVFDKTADVEADIQQAIGGTFTSAYESLRGAQAITDIEGTKATAAITRLQELKQSEPGYRQALADAKYEVFNLHNIVRQKAGLPPEENPFPPPQAGATGDGWTDLGNGIRIRQK